MDYGFEYYHIHSKDRVSGTPSEFDIELRNLYNIHAYHIDKIILPYTWYPFRDNVNNQLGLRFNNNNYVVTIEEGNYQSINDFRSELETKLKVIDNHFSVTYNNRKGLMTISHSSTNFELFFNPSDSRSANSMYREIGFLPNNKSGNKTYTSDYPINISGFDYIIIECDDITSSQKIYSTDNNDFRVLSKPMINVPWGSSLEHRPQLNAIHLMDINFQQKIVKFRILDQFRRPINLKNDWTLKLKLYKSADIINL